MVISVWHSVHNKIVVLADSNYINVSKGKHKRSCIDGKACKSTSSWIQIACMPLTDNVYSDYSIYPGNVFIF